MFKTLSKSIREYKKPTILSPIFVIGETVMEALIPYTIALLINEIKAGCGMDYYALGVVEWLTGANAGAQMEVDSNTGGAFNLSLPMAYAVAVGDTFRVRKDCNKVWDDASNGCSFHWGADRANHFRGFPDIPVADGGASMIPGAQISRA